MSNRLPSTRTIPALSMVEVSRVEAKIGELHGRLAAHPDHPMRYCVPSAKAVTTAERQALSVVAERLEADLAPWTDRRPVDTEISRILLGFEQGRGRGEVEEEILVGEYVAALKGLSLAAIRAAADRFRSGETRISWNRRFRPSPAEFATEAREGPNPQRLKLVHVRRVLAAEVYDPPSEADRAGVREAAAEYLKGRGFPEAGGRAAAAPGEVAAAREAALRESGAAAARAMDPNTAARLMGRLDARRAMAGAG